MDDETLRTALADHPSIDPRGDAFTVATAALDSEVSVAYGDLVVTVTMPDLDAVVRDDDLAEVVTESWFDALERHLLDGYDIVTMDAAADPVVVHGVDVVEVTYRLTGEDAADLAADAKALVDFVVGTYLQSAIPGYEYDEPMRALLGQARRRGRSDVDA